MCGVERRDCGGLWSFMPADLRSSILGGGRSAAGDDVARVVDVDQVGVVALVVVGWGGEGVLLEAGAGGGWVGGEGGDLEGAGVGDGEVGGGGALGLGGGKRREQEEQVHGAPV